MPSTATAFGKYLRSQRKAARVSQQELAKAVGVSHGYISQVESGERAPIGSAHWPAIVKAIAGVTIAGLERAAAMTRPLEIDLAKATPAQADLALALALRLRGRNLGDDETATLLDLVRSGGAPPVRAFGRVLDRDGMPVTGHAFAYRMNVGRGWSALVGVRAHASAAAGPMDSRSAALAGASFELPPAKDGRDAGLFDIPGGLPPGEYALDVHHLSKARGSAGPESVEEWAWPLVVTDGQASQDVRIVCAAAPPPTSAPATSSASTAARTEKSSRTRRSR